MFKKLVIAILIGLLAYPPFAFAGGVFDSKAFPGLEPDTYGSCFFYWDQGDARMHGDGSAQIDGSGLGNNTEQDTAGNQPIENATYLYFDGTDDYMTQAVIDDNQGAMTFVADAGSAEFRDAGQDFSEWETTSGNAKYCIVITTDNGISWGYMGASNNSGLDIDIYSDKALTTRGWKGRTTPQAEPDTAASYEVRVTDFNVTGDLSGIALVRFDDGQGSSLSIFSKYGDDGSKAYCLFKMTTGKIYFQSGANGTDTGSQRTDNAIFPNGQTDWMLVGFSYDASASDAIIYVDGIAPAQSESVAFPASIFDTPTTFRFGAYATAPTGFMYGDIAVAALFNDVLTAAEHLQVYNVLKARFGL